ncbi:MAG: glycoside hydrolase family 9 protein [Verrucomicrobia bacterium]|nr:glycoside hydrolase family 9 protein [Verrucomicrobiota bacterium]
MKAFNFLRVVGVFIFLCLANVAFAAANLAPNPSFELDAKRLGGWLPVGIEATNGGPRVFITNTVHRHGTRSLCVQPGQPGIVVGRRFATSYNGGEDELPASGTNGVRGARTIGFRLDEDITKVTGAVWILGSVDTQFQLSIVLTGREGRKPAVELLVDKASLVSREESGWRCYEIAATRPIRSHQVQLWIESDSTEPYYLDDVEIKMQRAPGLQVLVDQLGYETRSITKMAVLQSASPLPALPAARLIELANFREVERGEWQPTDAIADWDRSHWIFDFSTVTNRGRYVVATGEGKAETFSPPFTIGDDLLRQQTAEPGYRFFYYQRCGTAVPGFHAACHLDDARMPDGTHRDLAGGWHDAGDYNKYCGFTPEGFYALSVAYHRQPQLFDQWDRNQNGRADILEEALWGGEFLIKTFDKDSLEMVVNTISTGYRYWGAPELETDNKPGNSDDRPVKDVGGDRNWCVAGFALTGASLKKSGDTVRGDEFIRLAVRLHEKIGGGIETLAALHAATGDPKYRQAAQALAENILKQSKPDDSFRALGEFAAAFPDDPLLTRIKPVAERRMAELGAFYTPPFGLARFPVANGSPVYFQPYEDVNDWYVGGTMRHLDVAIEGALAAKLGVNAGRRLAENQVHWVLGRNPFGVSLMEGVGSRFVPNYHHRYNAIPGNPRGAVPGAILNGIIRAWPHQDRPWLDMSPEPNADYHCNEPWLPHNNRWMILMSVW